MRLFYAFFCLLLTNQAMADIKQSDMKSSLKTSSKMEDRKHLERPNDKAHVPASKTALPAPPKPVALIPQQATYLNPGILVQKGGRWEGGDHLLNLPHHIGVYVTIVKPKTETLTISEEKIKKEIEALFEEASIQPTTLAASGKPPLPAFQVEILLYPIEKGFAACCTGKLFESVTLDRFTLDSHMAFQAITWEKQSLVVGPISQIDGQLLKQVQDIVKAFIERFQAYERIKNSL